jgi:hypothetical protein
MSYMKSVRTVGTKYSKIACNIDNYDYDYPAYGLSKSSLVSFASSLPFLANDVCIKISLICLS